MNPENDRLLKPDEVASTAHLNCSKSHVYYLAQIGEIEALSLGESRGIRITESSVNAFIKRKITEYTENH
jgi:excisionase family DNA binding protein